MTKEKEYLLYCAFLTMTIQIMLHVYTLLSYKQGTFATQNEKAGSIEVK
ncbi:hypothetical protein MNB_SV-5-1831 [hydrothermal vent metagenome]|uniref:Uncharacterized protein n=1 Tax=hydrothermal vent metagenome TaxID=652676 RepID=A0A1W1EE83_9ZZZZ